jgi:nitronate monooxygenase
MTAFTSRFGLDHPIALAPMGGSAGGALASAVSDAGGLGFVGCGGGDQPWLDRELGLVSTTRSWGVGFLTWGVSAPAIARALEFGPSAVLLSFGDPAPFLPLVRDAGAAVVLQVGDLESARRAVDLGADVIVAQGVESGGHGWSTGRGTMAFVPVVVDLAGSIPVLAAGGIADGRGVAAALALGASGALIGTRFQATPEAVVDPRISTALVEGRAEDTVRSSVLDVVRGSSWPSQYPGRSLPHPLLSLWQDREEELRASPEAVVAAYRAGIADGSVPPPVWAGEGLDLVTSLVPAGELVRQIGEQAAAVLRALG